jgi:hypothetical protein
MTYQDLINTWGENLNREELSFEDEYMYVSDWYRLGETLPTKPFNTNFSDWEKYKGQQFEIIRPVYYTIEDVDLESLPLWEIKLDCGDIIWADCDEIFEIK